jgi:RNA-binding protein NOB1
MAQSYLVTSDVVLELRDKKGREVMREAELQLGLPGDGGLEGGKAGFLIREPTLESIAKG